MIELYCGKGKGKTTAAIGLCVRAAGNNIPVIIAQFLKDDTSGEMEILSGLEGVKLIHTDEFYGFVCHMTEIEKEKTKESLCGMLDRIEKEIERFTQPASSVTDDITAVVVLDELTHACNFDFIDEDKVCEMFKKYPNVEFVVTGREPSDKLCQIADYISEINQIRHPYQKGIDARKGIEF